MNPRLLVLMALLLLFLTGCDAAMAIFEIGWWVGVVAAVIVVGIVLLVMKARR